MSIKKSTNSGPPQKNLGLDWGAIRKRYEDRVDLDIANGVDNAETQARRRDIALGEEQARKEAERRAAKASTPKKVQPKGPGTKPRITDEQKRSMVLLWESGMSPVRIAKELGCSQPSVILHLKKEEIYDPKRHHHAIKGVAPVTAGKNAPPVSPNKDKEKCLNGHDLMDPDNVRIGTQTRNGKVSMLRSCRACERDRKQSSYQRLKEKLQGGSDA